MSEAPRNETQATISEWATATFGDGGTDLHAALRCLERCSCRVDSRPSEPSHAEAP